MKSNSILLAWLGALLFYAGVFLGLALSSAVAWAESEALVASPSNAELGLALHCPAMISAQQSAIVDAHITNLTEEEIKPVVTAEISHGELPRELRQTVLLGPQESTTVEWSVDAADVVFDRLILVSVLQSPYSDNPSRSGSCGILLFDLFGLNGGQTFALLLAASLLLSSAGGGLWTYARWPLAPFSVSIVQIHSILFGATLLTLVCTLAGRWGLAIFFDVVILIVLGVILTEFLFAGGKHSDSS